jgi:hypothetical protein
MNPPAASPLPPPPAITFATDWRDEHGCVCPKAVDYATQCPKGHALVAFTGRGGDASAQSVMCRVCHVITERNHASQWRVCSVQDAARNMPFANAAPVRCSKRLPLHRVATTFLYWCVPLHMYMTHIAG